MNPKRKTSLVLSIFIWILSGMLLPIASAGSPGTSGDITEVSFSCNGNDVVITWIQEQQGLILVSWDDGSGLEEAYVDASQEHYLVGGPGTFALKVQYYDWDTESSQYVRSIVSCLQEVPVSVEPTGHCFEDARVNKNCSATVQVYLTEVEEGWNMLLIGLPEDLGQAHVFFSWEDLAEMGPGESLQIGVVTLLHLPDDTWLLVAPREGGLPYYLHFNLGGPGNAYISDGDLG